MTSNTKAIIQRYPDVREFLHHLKATPPGFFEADIPIFINRTPGRLDLMGGNDDYSGGLVFETTILEATFAAVQKRSDQTVVFYNPGVRPLGWDERVEVPLGFLMDGRVVKPLEEVRTWITASEKRAWCAYILGDLYFLLKNFPEKITHGFNLYLHSDVPLGKGVSSSAALEVAPMKAIAALFDIVAEGVQLAEWTQWVEIALTQSACGIMDQVAVILGDHDAFVPMLCQPSEVYPLVSLPGNLKVWGIDSGVRHAVSGIEYEAARAATFMGYRLICELEQIEPQLDESGILSRYVDPLWNGYLANLSPSLFRQKYEQRLPDHLLGSNFNRRFAVHLDPATPVRDEVIYPLRAAVRYAVEENWRVHLFYNLLSGSVIADRKLSNNQNPSADVRIDERKGHLLGELMYQAHQGYSECELGSAATDQIVELVRGQHSNGLLGAKITGGGAGGTVAVLGWNTPEAETAFAEVVASYHKHSGVDPYIFRGSSPGADAFGVLEVTLATAEQLSEV